MVNVSELVEKTKSELFSATDNRELLDKTIKECSKNLRKLNVVLKVETSTSEKLKLTSAIGLMKGFRQMMKSLQVIEGAYTSNRSNCVSTRIKWEDVQSAFQNRIRTGLIINLMHEDPGAFLDDCVGMFRRHIQNPLKNEFALKINAAFCGDFKLVKGEEEIYEFEYMNTKNFPIYRDTNVDQWFKENVKDPILKDLEEFQVLFGTPEFTAPEVVNFDLISFYTDMWTLGVICYLLLSGFSPFVGDNDLETMTNVTLGKYDFEDEAFENISEEAKDFIKRLLIMDGKKRLTAAQALQHPWLKKIAQTTELASTKTKLKRYVIRKRWIKAVNTILALQRMGAKIDCNLI